MIVQCMKCGWLQYATSDAVADMMEQDHLLDDYCVGRVMRLKEMKA